MRTNYVITIARNFGAGGKSVGLALSKELGIPCYERQILTMASEKSGIDEKLFVDMDERLNGGFLAKKQASMPFSTVLEPREKDFTSDNGTKRILYRHRKMCRFRVATIWKCHQRLYRSTAERLHSYDHGADKRIGTACAADVQKDK